MKEITTFESFAKIATGKDPYPYQTQIARDGLPELLSVETGAGKTAAVIVGWLWRRFYHEDLNVRMNTPRWLVICEPMRSLTEQVFNNANDWVNSLIEQGVIEADSIGVHMLMGGKDHKKEQEILRRYPDRPAIIVGTLDMLLSRALNRGYAMSRFIWPIDFGLFNNGVHWVFDEVQLMGTALQTSRQLEGFRRKFGTVLATSSTWMSATVDPEIMKTVDNPSIDLSRIVRLGETDLQDESLSKRLNATKKIAHLEITSGDRPKQIASEIVKLHRAGTLTIAILNTVADAQDIFREIKRIDAHIDRVLLHSRFRPGDRVKHLESALESLDPTGPGKIIVSTQVVEAGVDISATTMFTEAAPWPSMVQRAGRCNRDGKAQDACFFWILPDKKAPSPYDAVDVERAIEELSKLEGLDVTATSMGLRSVPLKKVISPVIRSVDLLGLFDTASDISGNDIDISPYIRDGDDLNVYLAWRDLLGSLLESDIRPPSSDELCPVPLNKHLKAFIKKNTDTKRVLRFDHIEEKKWLPVRENELRPGLILLVDVNAGGYDSEIGWDSSSKSPVPLMDPSDGLDGDAPAFSDAEQSTGEDPLSTLRGRWVGLGEHLSDVERSASQIARGFGPGQVPDYFIDTVSIAGRLHDIGKAHPVFQQSIVKCADEDDKAYREATGPWAKSGSKKGLRHDRKFFRHELASALMLLGEGQVVLRGQKEPDLIIYLVAAHHGRVRLGIRSMPNEEANGYVLGIKDGESVPSVAIPNGEIPPTTLTLETMRLGCSDDGVASWSERMLALRDRADLGPFRLGFLEALVRLADWRASAEEEEQVQGLVPTTTSEV